MSLNINRIKDFLDERNLSIRQMEQQAGLANGTISRALKNATSINSKNLSKIYEAFPEISSWINEDSENTANEPEAIYAKRENTVRDIIARNSTLPQAEQLDIMIDENLKQSDEIRKLQGKINAALELNQKSLFEMFKESLKGK